MLGDQILDKPTFHFESTSKKIIIDLDLLKFHWHNKCSQTYYFGVECSVCYPHLNIFSSNITIKIFTILLLCSMIQKIFLMVPFANQYFFDTIGIRFNDHLKFLFIELHLLFFVQYKRFLDSILLNNFSLKRPFQYLHELYHKLINSFFVQKPYKEIVYFWKDLSRFVVSSHH